MMDESANRQAANDEIVDTLRSVLGQSKVLANADEVDRYSRCTIPWQTTCSAVVFPESTEEVAAVMRVAVQYQVPVWPSSKGRNWGYGTTLALENGAIVMILERMNRILEVNLELAYAVIEPGVTYEQFNAYLRANGFDLWIDCIDGTSQGSVIGNALERGVGETPYGDHFGNLCGLEVVLPDGEIVRTGGAASGLKTWHTHKWGIGPYLEGIFTQSNLGIVTRAGVWLMPKPECFNSYIYEIRDDRHLPAVFDVFRRLALTGIVSTKLHMINDFVSMTVLTQRIHEQVPQHGPLSEADLAGLRRKYGVAPWSCAGGVYGTHAQVRLQRRLLRKALGPYGRLIFVSDWQVPWIERLIALAWKYPLVRKLGEAVTGTSLPVLESAPHVHKVQQGIPTDFFVKHAYYRHRHDRLLQDGHPARDRCGLIWFAPILPFSHSEILPYLDACKARFAEHAFDFYVAMILMNPRSVICLIAILYDREEPQEVGRAESLYRLLLADMRKQGYQQYRAGWGSWPTLFADAPELQRLNDRLKAALDPAGVLAPGRYGIGARPLPGRDPASDTQ